ncbi:MAG: tRNA (adenosine(37)-N6)-threonylcarbamoyltransferase complex ATPase subunit type 1 TsaE [Deltaproteobacteria bacterium]|nr:tRNA (adenosine(37)-N6)-threonylcarbamoyltransferase complex ATPase subunit type 1 TsaE [Deltaproteobacteria bacterium]
MIKTVTNSVEETEALGEEFARGLKPGSVVALYGELGAGKTAFVRGIAKGLKVEANVKSPSFTIINEYKGGSLPLYHIDLYRLEGKESIEHLGLEEYVYSNGVCVIEWAERAEHVLPENAVKVVLLYDGDGRRRIDLAA